MTDGIIQKVIHSYNKIYCFDSEIHELLSQIQQELIEEIKKEIHREDFNRYCDCEKKLIGK